MVRARGQRLASIQLKGWIKQVIEAACDDVQKSTTSIGLRTSGTVRLPTERERWSVLRSPFVHKGAIDQARHAHPRTHRSSPSPLTRALAPLSPPASTAAVRAAHIQPAHRDLRGGDAVTRRHQDGALPPLPRAHHPPGARRRASKSHALLERGSCGRTIQLQRGYLTLL